MLRHPAAGQLTLGRLKEADILGFGGSIDLLPSKTPVTTPTLETLPTILTPLEKKRAERAARENGAIARPLGLFGIDHSTMTPETEDPDFDRHADEALDVANSSSRQTLPPLKPAHLAIAASLLPDTDGAVVVDAASRTPRIKVDAERVRGGLFLDELIADGFPSE
jgi:hypothetical protein